jgi:hypothetical protein
MALRAGLRRGEHVAVQWGDMQFGRDEHDANRFVVVQHNYVRREHTTTKSKKIRRVNVSRELRRASNTEFASADCGQIMANRNESDYFSFADQADRT